MSPLLLVTFPTLKSKYKRYGLRYKELWLKFRSASVENRQGGSEEWRMEVERVIINVNGLPMQSGISSKKHYNMRTLALRERAVGSLRLEHISPFGIDLRLVPFVIQLHADIAKFMRIERYISTAKRALSRPVNSAARCGIILRADQCQ